jgi:hypothetical protein
MRLIDLFSIYSTTLDRKMIMNANMSGRKYLEVGSLIYVKVLLHYSTGELEENHESLKKKPRFRALP